METPTDLQQKSKEKVLSSLKENEDDFLSEINDTSQTTES